MRQIFQSGRVRPSHLAQFVTDAVADDTGTTVPALGGMLTAAERVNFNSANSDNPIPINLPVGFDKYRINRILISGASAGCANATCAVYTKPGATGRIIVNPTNVTVSSTSSDTPNSMQSLIVGAQDVTAFIDTTIYFQVINAQGAPATATVTVLYEPLPITQGVIGPSPPSGPFSSAGVFDANGVLVRTIWSAQLNDPRANNPVAAWDGTLDDGSVAPTGTYTITVLSHNCNYTWEGAIGNSSPDHSQVSLFQDPTTGGQVYKGYHSYGGSISDFCIGPAGDIFFTTGYDERMNTLHHSTTANPQYADGIYPQGFRLTGANQAHCCTDGTIAYFHFGNSSNAPGLDYVHGYNLSTKTGVAFASGIGSGQFSGSGNQIGGTPFIPTTAASGDGVHATLTFASQPWTFPIGSTISVAGLTPAGYNGSFTVTASSATSVSYANTTTGAQTVAGTVTALQIPQGIGVQQSGNYLFISRQMSFVGTVTTYAVWTLNKTTGALLQINLLGFTDQAGLCVDPTTGNPWVAYNVITATASAVFDPQNSNRVPGLTFSNGNLTVTNQATTTGLYALTDGSGTKFYFEIVVNNSALPNTFDIAIGVTSTFFNSGGFLGHPTDIGYFGNGTVNFNNTQIDSAALSYGIGDNIGVAVDLANNKIWFRKNGGQWNHDILANQNPATNTGGYNITGIGTPVFGVVNFPTSDVGQQATGKFATASWTYTNPTGFNQLPGIQRAGTVSKLNFDGSGNLTDSGVKATALTGAVVGLAISPDGSTLLCADSGSQQIKAFNTSDGSVKTAWGISGALGDAGGYANGPAVSNTRYMFASIGGFSNSTGWVAYAPDGSFWFGDAGNFRYLHFSAGNSPAYLEQIGYFPGFYACWTCRNNANRVFGQYLEYAIDYTKPLAPANGSWTLTYNWGYQIPGGAQTYSPMRWTIQASNGHTYVLIGTKIFELITTGTGYRDTGVTISADYIDNQFNLWAISGTPSGSQGQVQPGDQAQFFVNFLTGFDGSNNPTYTSNPTVRPSALFVQSQALPSLFPQFDVSNNSSMMVETLANGVIPIYNVHGYVPDGFTTQTQYHFGGINSITGALQFKAHPPPNFRITGRGQWGFFAPIPCYPIVQQHPPYDWDNGMTDHAGSFQAFVPGMSDVFTGHAGEGWDNNQTNVWHHWHQSGLLVNRFGCAAPYFPTTQTGGGGGGMSAGYFATALPSNGLAMPSQLATYDGFPGLGPLPPPGNSTYGYMGTPGLAGNVGNGGVAFANGNYYLYTADEWYHGGIHRWKIGNLPSITLTSTAPINWNSGSYVPPTPNPFDFTAGLPFATANVPNGSGGWTRNPTTDSASWTVTTSNITSDLHQPPDISAGVNLNSSTASLTYAWTRLLTGNWSLNGTILQFVGFTAMSIDESNNPTLQTFAYFAVLDNNGKTIIRFEHLNRRGFFGSPPVGNSGSSMWVNYKRATSTGLLLGTQWQNQGTWNIYTSIPRALSIVANVLAQTMSFTYGDYTVNNVPLYDNTANIARPTTFGIFFDTTQWSGGTTIQTTIGIQRMIFADIP
jgi:hypothetical protein